MNTGMKTSDECVLPEFARTVNVGLLFAFIVYAFHYFDPTFFSHDDYLNVSLPWYEEVGRTIREGRFPLLSESSWTAGALVAESGPTTFSIFHVALSTVVSLLGLPIAQTCTFITAVYMAFLSAGCFRLARQKSIPVHFALVAAAVGAFNGWNIAWASKTWIGYLQGIVWLPWAWWALGVNYRNGPYSYLRYIFPSIFIYLVIASEATTIIMMLGLILTWHFIRMVSSRASLRELGHVVLSFLIGLGLSLPTMLMFIQRYPYSERAIEGSPEWTTTLWMIPYQAFLGLVLPAYPTPLWNTFRGEPMHPSVELATGMIPVIAIVAVCLRKPLEFLKTFIWEIVLISVCLVLTTSTAIGNFRYGFRWLPLFHIVIGLVSAQCLNILYSNNEPSGKTGWLSRFRRMPESLLVLLSVVSIAATVLIALYWHPGLVGHKFYKLFGPGVIWLGYVSSGVVLAWLVVSIICYSKAPLRKWLPAVLTVSLLCASYYKLPTLFTIRPKFPESIRRHGTLDPRVTYMSLHTMGDFFQFKNPGYGKLIRPGNSSMYAGLKYVHGTTPLILWGMNKFLGVDSHGWQLPKQCVRVGREETGPDGLLFRMGVHGLIVGKSVERLIPGLLELDWRLCASDESASVLCRSGFNQSATHQVLPIYKSLMTPEMSPDGNSVQVEHSSPYVLICNVDFQSETESRSLVLSRPWYPGYQAWLAGSEIKIGRYSGVIPAIEIKPGTKGILLLAYQPLSLIAGLFCACTSIGFLSICSTLTFVRER
jgi:hypothetical protein